jgi:hypothetical protein
MSNFEDQTQEESGDYFWEVYDSDPEQDLEGSRQQFDIAYGHKTGGGSAKITTAQPNAQEASKAIYFQHNNILKDPANLNSDFFQSEGTSFLVPDPAKTGNEVVESGISNVGNDDRFSLVSTPSYITSQVMDPNAENPQDDTANTVIVHAFRDSTFLGQAAVEVYNSSTGRVRLNAPIQGIKDAYIDSGAELRLRLFEDAKRIGVEGQDQFFAIHLDRSRYKQKFDPGNWEIRLFFPGAPNPNRTDLSSSDNIYSTGEDFKEGSGAYQGPNYDSSGAQLRYETSSSGLSTSYEGNYSVLKLVDEAAETDFNNEELNVGSVGREFRVLSGSLNLDRNNTNTPDVIQPEEYSQVGGIPQRIYGRFYPDIGLVLLDPKMLQYHAMYINKDGPVRNVLEAGEGEIDDSFEYADLAAALGNGTDPDYGQEYFEDQVDLSREVGERIVGGNPERDPTIRQEEQIKPITDKDAEYQNHSLLYNAVKRGGYFVGRSAEEIISSTYFVRAKNRDFNFSNNPTFVDRSNGQIRNEEFIGDPKVYITTVGLYDDNNSLVAVGKLSNPVLKDFQNEALIRVKLDY